MGISAAVVSFRAIAPAASVSPPPGTDAARTRKLDRQTGTADPGRLERQGTTDENPRDIILRGVGADALWNSSSARATGGEATIVETTVWVGVWAAFTTSGPAPRGEDGATSVARRHWPPGRAARRAGRGPRALALGGVDP